MLLSLHEAAREGHPTRQTPVRVPPWPRISRRRVAAGAATTVLLGTIGLSGCGSSTGDCISICEDFEACPKPGPKASASEIESACTKLCNQEEKIVERAHCAGAFDDAISCVANAPDICKSGSECNGGTGMTTMCTGPCVSEDNALSACLSTFCKDPKNASLCAL